MIQAVIFDLDGTLLDTLEDLCDSVNAALQKNALPPRPLAQVRQFVGNGIHTLIERAVPEGTREELIEKVFQDFRLYYMEHCEDKTCVYPGVAKLLDELAKQKIAAAIVSNKADGAVKELAKKYFPNIHVAIGEREGIARKPAPDSVLEVLSLLEMSAGQALYVGDSDVDIATARNTGLPCVSVCWGFREETFLRNFHPDYIIHRPDELLDIIANLQGQES